MIDNKFNVRLMRNVVQLLWLQKAYVTKDKKNTDDLVQIFVRCMHFAQIMQSGQMQVILDWNVAI